MNKQSLEKFRKVLTAEKERLESLSRQALRTELTLSTDDLADEVDLAVSELNQSLMFRLRNRERQLLDKINAAIARVESGDFGICTDCEEEIEIRRLLARPVTTLCLSCKERQEHQEKVYA